MNYINLNSNRGVVNLFADYIVKEINKTGNHDSVIEVTDCGRFLVVNGFTNVKEIIDMSEIKVKFATEYEELLKSIGYENINIIDLITYGVELTKKNEMWFKFYNSTRILYPQELINESNKMGEIYFHSITPELQVELDYNQKEIQSHKFAYVPLNISSEFPHGYSLSMGRDMLYYSEYICSHFEHSFRTGDIEFKFSLNINEDEDYNISITTDSVYSDNHIKSLTLDVFDFNLDKFRNELKLYDITEDLTKPFEPKPWVTKDKLSEMFIF